MLCRYFHSQLQCLMFESSRTAIQWTFLVWLQKYFQLRMWSYCGIRKMSITSDSGNGVQASVCLRGNRSNNLKFCIMANRTWVYTMYRAIRATTYDEVIIRRKLLRGFRFDLRILISNKFWLLCKSSHICLLKRRIRISHPNIYIVQTMNPSERKNSTVLCIYDNHVSYINKYIIVCFCFIQTANIPFT